MKQQDVIAALAALAQESRLAIYRLVVKRGPEGYAAGETCPANLGPVPCTLEVSTIPPMPRVRTRRSTRHSWHCHRMNCRATDVHGDSGRAGRHDLLVVRIVNSSKGWYAAGLH
jgi:hypothetical protein